MVRVIAAALCFIMVALSSKETLANRGGGIDTQSSRYAALVMDADTGEIFYSRNADSKRFPASLTKMMTLYMTFEALSQGKLTMSTELEVSPKAANQPQTNVGLEEGDTIRVADAIRALVVHSANDVSVVLAEAIANSDSAFATRMTKKARELGMQNTVFRNPNGLPDVNQYTTARDMAKLGIALRRDFPQYYNFFKTKEFRWGGRTYTSHNRVFGKFPGVDGIKTGYIRMSGFNLVTSVNHNGYNVIAVVMGGQTAAMRDSHMVSLLERTFEVLADRGDRPRGFASASGKARVKSVEYTVASASSTDVQTTPNPRERAKEEAEAARMPVEKKTVLYTEPEVTSDAPIVLALGGAKITPKDKPTDIPQAKTVADNKPAPTTPATNTAAPQQIASVATPTLPANSPFEIRPDNSPFQVISSASASAKASGEWGIQVGAFQDEPSAISAATQAMKIAKDTLKDSKVQVTGGGQYASVHRARIANLSEFQAKKACQTLVAKNAQCFVYRAERLRDL